MHTYESASGAFQAQKNPSSSSVKVGVVGARGYAGLDLVRILLKHPNVEISACFGTETFSMADYMPEKKGWALPVLPIDELEKLAPELHTVFLATPAETSLELAPKLLSLGANVIDLSGAFRLKGGPDSTLEDRQKIYRDWYGLEHTEGELIGKADFGLVPWAGPANNSGPCNDREGRLVSNPGCYATSVLMAILPLLKAQLIDLDSLVIDAKSGTSGAGRKAAESLMFTEVDGECLPYKVGKHQHLPEIKEYAATFAQAEIDPIFSTSLLPTRRGIISGIYARVWDGITIQDVERAFAAAYSAYPLVRVGRVNEPGRKMASPLLSLKRVVGTARTHIAYELQGNKLFVYSSIDNLLKGAASQAVENFNRLCDLPVATSLIELEGVL